ncbi:hypothetical protein KDN34_14200 [Shewanella yunxiaonensis]|uniref:Nitrogenase-stabilizing/protective protein NifW n=1 Tax=Shewanella yunxiaonensis TaxID=2829809 RepID=A0ABX7YRE1_9GAMM|nr:MULTISPECIES: nitrogenase-stabilizing/protective protein NifW [Shewanella]MDF0535870.1 nitrogenase-stabilizing/protective protein NifW [Shewanella sp. A32]QUN05334.1 hypothetical protein KDN34_14200 [Shewanella yunxiaonensis]
METIQVENITVEPEASWHNRRGPAATVLPETLQTAEDFLDYFNVKYDPELVTTKRVQILRLYHAILERYDPPLTKEHHRKAVRIAYGSLAMGQELAFADMGCGDCSGCSV